MKECYKERIVVNIYCAYVGQIWKKLAGVISLGVK
jgi:hypothetical protein